MSAPSFNNKGCYAGFLSRLIAYGLDCLFFFVLWKMLFTFSFADQVIFFDYTVNDIAYYALRSLLFALFLSHMGATPGKYIMGLRVVSANGNNLSFGKALYRETVGRYLSSVFLYVGYLFIPFHRQKKAFHDIISDTLVVFRGMTMAATPQPQNTPPMPPASSETPEETPLHQEEEKEVTIPTAADSPFTTAYQEPEIITINLTEETTDTTEE